MAKAMWMHRSKEGVLYFSDGAAEGLVMAGYHGSANPCASTEADGTEISDPSLPVSILHLLAPPLKLLSAAMWQVVEQWAVVHYGKLEEFVSVVMEVFPELLNESQRMELTQGLQNPGCKMDPTLKAEFWEFLSRLDQLLSVPNLQQTVSLLSAAPSVLEVCLQSLYDPYELKTVLKHHRSFEQLDRNATFTSVEDCRLSSASEPRPQGVLDSVALKIANRQSECTTDCMKSLSLPSLVKGIQAESVIGSSDKKALHGKQCLNSYKDMETNGRKIGLDLIGEKQDLEIKIEDVRVDQRVEREDKNMRCERNALREGDSPVQVSRTEKGKIVNGVILEQGHQGQEQSVVVRPCRVLIHRLEIVNNSLLVLSRRQPVVKPPRARVSRRKKALDVSLKRIMMFPSSQDEGNQNQGSRHRGPAVEASSPLFSCCQSIFAHTEEENLQQHVMKVHPEELSRTPESQQPPSSSDPHSAPPYTVPTPTQSHTASPDAKTCTLCGTSFHSLINLRMHERIHKKDHPKYHHKPVKSYHKYQCSYCERGYKTLISLRKHQKTHTQKSTFNCNHCPKTFMQLCSLKRHQRTHTGENPYCCSQCGKSFTRLSNLKEHKRLHTGERPFVCSQCGKSFIRPYKLTRHQRTHTGERPYHCPECGRSFADLCSLRDHQKTHTGDCPYKCSQCGKGFPRVYKLKVHQWYHTGEHPYRCSECGKGFCRPYALKLHQQIHTGKRPYRCSQCGKGYSRARDLNAHLQTHMSKSP